VRVGVARGWRVCGLGCGVLLLPRAEIVGALGTVRDRSVLYRVRKVSRACGLPSGDAASRPHAGWGIRPGRVRASWRSARDAGASAAGRARHVRGIEQSVASPPDGE